MATTRQRREAAAPDGALLRLPVHSGDWAEHLPPVPAGCSVTVSFTSTAAADEHGDAVTLLGYVVVGVAADRQDRDDDAAHVLVRQALLEAHPRYWRSLAAQADAAFSLALGPAQRVVAAVVARHVAGVRTGLGRAPK